MAEQLVFDARAREAATIIPDVLEQVFLEITDTLENMDYSPVLEDIHDALLVDHAEYFGRQESPSGDPWQPLAESTIRAKGHDAILFDQGDLEASLTSETGDHIKDITPEYLVFGTSDEKSAKHQKGGKNLPQRPHVGMNDDTVDRSAEQIADFIVEQLKQ